MRVVGTITPAEAATILGRSTDWLREHGHWYCREQRSNGRWVYGKDENGKPVPVIPS